jgi:L-threonylcarbamoyladenylate synthase
MPIFKSLENNDLTNLIKSGSIGILPTDTVYGLVCSALNEESCRRLYQVKSRENKPGTIIAADIDQVVELGLRKRYLTAVKQFWPGPVSVIIPCSQNLDYLTQNKPSIAVRIPKSIKVNNLLKKTGPLLTTSANNPGEPTVNNLTEALEIFERSVDFFVDGGDYKNRSPSAIIRIIDDEIEIVRPGKL